MITISCTFWNNRNPLKLYELTIFITCWLRNFTKTAELNGLCQIHLMETDEIFIADIWYFLNIPNNMFDVRILTFVFKIEPSRPVQLSCSKSSPLVLFNFCVQNRALSSCSTFVFKIEPSRPVQLSCSKSSPLVLYSSQNIANTADFFSNWRTFIREYIKY